MSAERVVLSSRVRRLCLIDDYHRPEDPGLERVLPECNQDHSRQPDPAKRALRDTCQPPAEKNAAIPNRRYGDDDE